jgi:hypothetical protein
MQTPSADIVRRAFYLAGVGDPPIPPFAQPQKAPTTKMHNHDPLETWNAPASPQAGSRGAALSWGIKGRGYLQPGVIRPPHHPGNGSLFLVAS